MLKHLSAVCCGRDEAQGKIQALKERSEKDRQQHDTELKDLLRTISHDNKVKDFMGIKASERMEYKAEEAAKKKKGQRTPALTGGAWVWDW